MLFQRFLKHIFNIFKSVTFLKRAHFREGKPSPVHDFFLISYLLRARSILGYLFERFSIDHSHRIFKEIVRIDSNTESWLRVNKPMIQMMPPSATDIL